MDFLKRARKKWPKAEWIIGDGPWASVSYCPGGLTVMLFGTCAEAAKAKSVIDENGCSGTCQLDHKIEQLVVGQ